MKAILNKLFEYKSLDHATARDVLLQLAKGEYNISQMAAFMTVYLMRSITVDELSGFRDAMLELCKAVDLSGFDVMDIVGTGGDGKDTFNISTAASFVVASSGQPVAKHGNIGVSSICGSSNVLEYFGVKFTDNKDVIRRSLEKCNFCFLHAPLFHPAMKTVAPIRKELGVKTFFNMLGPLVNPSFPRKQVLGVFSLELLRLYGYLYQKKKEPFSIIHSLDGYDEISLTGTGKMISENGEHIFSAEDFGLKSVSDKAISGGKTIEDSGKIFLDILSGKGTEAQTDVVIANAAVALSCGDKLSFSEAAGRARDTLMSGKALNTFKTFVEVYA